jgi:hypothetical protein
MSIPGFHVTDVMEFASDTRGQDLQYLRARLLVSAGAAFSAG